ncbi:MAG TPA: hypothetical protein VFI13_06720 [Gemmatimonadales bacterium]|nr:hypothetical protein [Gemmatimonadales bacterium]
MKGLLPLALFLAACAVPPQLDPATLDPVPAEEKFVLTSADSSRVTVDHLQVLPDAVRGRRIPPAGADTSADYAVPRDSLATIRRYYRNSPGIELAFIPAILFVAMIEVLRYGLGND